MKDLSVQSNCQPVLDAGFVPAALWNRNFLDLASSHSGARTVVFGIYRPDGSCSRYSTRLLPDRTNFAELNICYSERLVKFLLWAWGGHRIVIQGAPEIAAQLSAMYSATGVRSFDFDFLGGTVFGEPLVVESGTVKESAPSESDRAEMTYQVNGCRIGFDLGGSDRKCAAIIDGKVVHSEEIKWNPYFESEPTYHLAGIRDSLERAVAHLPRLDAIGGSAAGIYINNEPRVGSLFRGLSAEDFDRHIRGLFRTLESEWKVPISVANDGDVTALAGAMSLGENAVLGVSLGTSQAAGYVNSQGRITGWLNELAFAPVDYRRNAPTDEWSGDAGCGVQYFSQQAVARLIPASGLDISGELPFAEQLESVQAEAARGDERAFDIYRTIGSYLGYTVAHYREFYDFRHLLLLGRVTSGEGGEVVLENAREVLKVEFPELADQVSLSMPDEQMKRHGQAVAAAALPIL
tara:strand:- start:6340 stop:7731 length:1392 start_codon:yes stop_codon:yes gene_type:complete